MAGFLTHTGFSHGGNGYEAMAFLLDRFRDSGLADPADPGHGLDLKTMAREFATQYRRDKAKARAAVRASRPVAG